MMSVLQKNVLANFLGKGWSLLMGLVFVPFYIRFLGVEAYGIIGFFSTLLVAVSLLEFGLSATMNREMARYSVQPERSDEGRRSSGPDFTTSPWQPCRNLVDAGRDFWLTLGPWDDLFKAKLKKCLGCRDVVLVNPGSGGPL